MIRNKYDIMTEISPRIKEMRETLGFTHEKMAGHLGVQRPSYGKYEHGEAFPGPGALYKLLNTFNVSLNWLIGNKGPKFYKEETKQANREASMTGDLNRLKTLLESAEIKELLTHIQRIPLLRYKVLAFFQEFKIQYRDLVDSAMKDSPAVD